MQKQRLAVLGFALVAVGFGFWALRAMGAGVAVYTWTNLLRVAAGTLAAVGLGLILRGGTTNVFRAGIYGFLAAACVTLFYNVTGTITLPEDISTLFGFAGAAAATYGASHWFEARGDPLSAWWVATGAFLMGCNPGLYVLLGIVRGDLWAGGWMAGSLVAAVGWFLVAATVTSLVAPAPTRPGTRRVGQAGARKGAAQ